jgi:hypothetical protein
MNSDIIQPRENYVCVEVGDRHTGKTTWVLGNKELSIEGLIPSYLGNGMKVLVIMTLYHNAYNDIPEITIKQLPRWKKGVFKLIVPEYRFNEVYPIIRKYVWNALIIVEDS